MKDIEALEAIFKQSLVRAQTGQEKYGVYNPDTDRRQMPLEALEELLDACAYLGFSIYKLNSRLAWTCNSCASWKPFEQKNACTWGICEDPTAIDAINLGPEEPLKTKWYFGCKHFEPMETTPCEEGSCSIDLSDNK